VADPRKRNVLGHPIRLLHHNVLNAHMHPSVCVCPII